METKLIKKKDGWYNLYQDNIGIGSTHSELQGYKLSLKNCQAIERGYDLDELASHNSFSYTWLESNEKDKAIMSKYGIEGFKAGFQKALELLGDKKFSEEDLRLAMHFGQFGEANNQTTTIGFIQSLQHVEWDVDIVVEDTFVSNQGLGYNEFVTCRVLKIEGNNVYGEYIKGTKTNLDVPFSLSALNDIEGNSIGEQKLDADGCLILKRI